MKQNEHLLQFIWHQRLYQSLSFFNTEEYERPHPIEVLNPGTPNPNAGPDFFNAKIRIGAIVWAGNVEIHRYASEWYKHRHHEDPLYDNTILHVILENDKPVYSRVNGLPIFSCIMTLSENQVKQATSLQEEKSSRLRCAGQLQLLPLAVEKDWKEYLFHERMQQKAERIEQIYASTGEDISETLHILIMRYWGTKVNNDAFEAIARSLPMRILRKHTNRLDQLEALYLGQAGLLEESPADEYNAHLQEEYSFLRAKYQLTPISAHRLRLLRLRPSVFPHRRLAQMANLRHRYPLLESVFSELKESKRALEILSIPPSEYWQKHYRFGEKTSRSIGKTSRSSSDIMLINVLLPYRLFLAKQQALSCYTDVKRWAEQIRPEENNITKLFTTEGIDIANAFEGQAIIELWEKYCSLQKCSSCAWGKHLIASNTCTSI